MEKMQEIKEYINTMKIKKTIFGGYDREDVYTKLGVITGMFQKYIEEFQKSEENQREEFEKKIRAAEEEIAKLQQRIGVLLNENQNAAETIKTTLEEKKIAIEARDAAIEEKNAEEDKRELLQEENRKQQEQLAKRENQVEELQEIQKRLENEKLSMKQSYKSYCSNVLQQYSESLRALSSEFSQILENVTKLQKAVGEAEAMDIFEIAGEDQLKMIEETVEIKGE